MIQEDLTAFLDLEEFAVEVRSDYPARTFAAIFDEAGDVTEVGGMEMETLNPTLTCDYRDVQDFVWRETVVSVEGHGEYTVMRIKNEGAAASVELVEYGT